MFAHQLKLPRLRVEVELQLDVRFVKPIAFALQRFVLLRERLKLCADVQFVAVSGFWGWTIGSCSLKAP